MRTLSVYRAILAIVAAACAGRINAAWLPEIRTATFRSPSDGSEQKTLVYVPPGDEPVPLLVAFHTWSGDYLQDESPYAEWCIARGCAMLHPDLRGPSNSPEGAGSDLALSDLRAALDFVKEKRAIDPERIYAIGVSGGGMLALLAAARMPDEWAAVSAWVPVTDLVDWHADSLARKNKYAGEIERVCGGPPGASPSVDAAYASRSVLDRFVGAKVLVPLDINTGIHDGHTGSVPVSHAIRAFNAVAAEADRIPPPAITAMASTRLVPAELAFNGADPLHDTHPVLLRRTSGKARLTIFEGGHEILHEAALVWLESQRRGMPVHWQVQPHSPPVVSRAVTASGK